MTRAVLVEVALRQAQDRQVAHPGIAQSFAEYSKDGFEPQRHEGHRGKIICWVYIKSTRLVEIPGRILPEPLFLPEKAR